MIDLEFYKNKKVFITGHTGFKGAWLSHLLIERGAEVTGYSLSPNTNPNLYDLCNLSKKMNSIIADIRDFDTLKQSIEATKPDIVLHLAAQPLVRKSYLNPVYTYETNVMGTVNLLECIRMAKVPPRSVVNITTDKVYHNNEWAWGYRENDPLDGFDPYSNSKSCSELVTHSYINSFFNTMNIAVSTARAGNVIGGGDFSKDRIIPDCIRAAQDKKNIIIRNPNSTRPYQHVLDPIYAYLLLAKRQYHDKTLTGSYNIGPNDTDCITTKTLVEIFCNKWGEDANFTVEQEKNALHEAKFLKLDCSKIKSKLHWYPRWNIGTAIEKVVEWHKVYLSNHDITLVMNKHIKEFLEEK